jgi:hypothetical protein
VTQVTPFTIIFVLTTPKRQPSATKGATMLYGQHRTFQKTIMSTFLVFGLGCKFTSLIYLFKSIWGRKSSSCSNSSASCWQIESSNSSNPYPFHIFHIYLEEGSVWENESRKSGHPSSSSMVYYKDMEDGETKGLQSSSSSGKSH